MTMVLAAKRDVAAKVILDALDMIVDVNWPVG